MKTTWNDTSFSFESGVLVVPTLDTFGNYNTVKCEIHMNCAVSHLAMGWRLLGQLS